MNEKVRYLRRTLEIVAPPSLVEAHRFCRNVEHYIRLNIVETIFMALFGRRAFIASHPLSRGHLHVTLLIHRALKCTTLQEADDRVDHLNHQAPPLPYRTVPA